MAADRGAFICQSQPFNCFMIEPSYTKLSSMHFYGPGRRGSRRACTTCAPQGRLRCNQVHRRPVVAQGEDRLRRQVVGGLDARARGVPLVRRLGVRRRSLLGASAAREAAG